MSVLFWLLAIGTGLVCAVFAFMAGYSFWVSHRILEMQRPPKERET